MSAYDFTAARDFLKHEAGATPRELYEEIWAAWSDVAHIETRRNRRIVESVRDTLLTCADLVERMMPRTETVP